MDFEEKIDAMRTTLELAILDTEAQRASIQELRTVAERQNEGMKEMRTSFQELRTSFQELRTSFQELRTLSQSQYENVRGLIKVTGELAAVADSHERRISKLERRMDA